MSFAARIARLGDRVLTFVAMLLVLLMMLYGGYSLYDNWLINQAGSGSDLMRFKPSDGQVYSLAELAAINPDVIAWLTIDDTNIDQPVTQGKDDMEYVNKDALGDFSLSGSIFLSCLNERDFSDAYNLTYGHHMDNGGMYGDVTKFLDKDFFEKHRTGSLMSMDRTWTIELFSVVKTDASANAVYGVSQWKENNEGLRQWLKENELYSRDVAFDPDDSIIALSTCYDVETNGRVIVFGKLELQEVKNG